MRVADVPHQLGIAQPASGCRHGRGQVQAAPCQCGAALVEHALIPRTFGATPRPRAWGSGLRTAKSTGTPRVPSPTVTSSSTPSMPETTREAAGATALELAPARSALSRAKHALAQAKVSLAQGDAGRARMHLEAAQADCLATQQLSHQAHVSVAGGTPVLSKRYEVRRGDTLWGISTMGRVYHDPYMWPMIYRANRYQIYDPDLIYPQQILTIPRDYSREEADAAIQRARKRGPWHLGDGPDVYILEGIRS